MVRQSMVAQYGDEAYTRGLTVTTTLQSSEQQAAYQALRRGILTYESRQRYRGPELFVSLPADKAAREDVIDGVLAEHPDNGDLLSAIVLEAGPRKVVVVRQDGEPFAITGEGLRPVRSGLAEKADPSIKLRPGAVVRVVRTSAKDWRISQLPEVESAFVAMDPNTGAVHALVGGFDFQKNKFNHVTQAWRQPGSSFKPFIYSAALEKGFTAATIVNDAPLTYTAEQTGSEAWEPRNYDGKFEGPMRLRTALAKSKNLVSVRVLQAITPQYAQDYIARFGFDPKLHPPYLTMALGAGSVTPMQMLGAYSVFANGGYRVAPYFIDRVEDSKGNVLLVNQPLTAGGTAERVIDPRNAFIMSSIMRDVVRAGTATRAMRLKRSDLAGKTGTTNEFVDAWFCGFQPNLVAIAWMGFDQPKTLGRNETGGNAALPIWIDYMGPMLKGAPELSLNPPPGIIAMQIDPETGAHAISSGGINEYFYQEFPAPDLAAEAVPGGEKLPDDARNQLF
jgi:penicillin-binding protein 1A